MQVLIFGATGNCGRYCSKAFLDDGWEVFAVGRSNTNFTHPNFNFIKGDICDDTLYGKLPQNLDLVINFAGVQPSILKHSENTDFEKTMMSYVDINVRGVLKVLEFVRRSGTKTYIYSTTHRDYENYWSNGNFLKNDLPPAINLDGDHTMYAITKTSGKMMGDYYAKAFGIRVFNLRLPMMFLVPQEPYYLSDGQPILMPFLRVIRAAINGEKLEIWGDPEMKRDYVHVGNLINLIKLCQSSDLDGGTFNVGTGEAVTTEAFIRTIGTTFAADPENVDYVYRPEKVTYKCAIYDVAEQINLLGYKPILLKQMLVMLKEQLHDEGYLSEWGWV